MRPNHQNKRMRGRNRPGGGGGKGPNPLTRSYESNGPDVKIRGAAQHIAEKYVQLGRDAQSSGDHVAAESYFQHAEHYFRVIAAAHETLRQQNPQYRPYESGADQDDEGDDDAPFGHGSPQPESRFPANGGDVDDQPKPAHFAPQQRDYTPREQREPREFQPRGDREQPRREFQPREQRDYRDVQPRENRGERDMAPRAPREPRFARESRGERAAPMDAPGSDAGLPSFITAPVRPLPPMMNGEAEGEPHGEPVNGDDTGSFPLRSRRRRGRPARDHGEEAGAPDDASAGE